MLFSVIDPPVNLGRLGLAPSNPPCNGTINLRVLMLTLVVNVSAVNASSNDPLYAVAKLGKPASDACDTSPR